MLELQDKGHDASLIMPLPPVLIFWGKEEVSKQTPKADAIGGHGLEDGEVAYVSCVDLRGDGSKADPGAPGREALVNTVSMFPSLNITLDGAAWASSAGVSVAAKEVNDFLSSQTRAERKQPFRWVLLEKDDCVNAWCNRKRPGDNTFWAIAHQGLDASLNEALAKLTQPPPQVPETTVLDGEEIDEGEEGEEGEEGAAGGGGDSEDDDDSLLQRGPLQAAAAAAAAAAVNARAAAAAARPGACCDGFKWAYKSLNDMNFDPETYMSPVQEQRMVHVSSGMADASGPRGRYGIELPLTEATWVRLPALPEDYGQRALPDAAWGNLSVIPYAALCILHAGMRTGEALFTRVLAALFNDYATSGLVRTAVDTHLNPQLAKLSIRKLARNAGAAEAGATATAKHSFDGTSVQKWLMDLLMGLVDHTPDLSRDWGLRHSRSRFLRGVANALHHLGRLDDYNQFVKALPTLRSFAIGMKAAFEMRPTEQDYLDVERYLPAFVVGKMTLYPGSNTWYDNHCMFVIPQMMRQWGSLRLVSQEGMEAWQKKLNDILRMNNGFANAGAIPHDVQELGQEAVDAYMEARARHKGVEARWIYEQALLRLHASWQPVVKRQDELRKANFGNLPREMEWPEFYTYWQRYLTCATVFVRLLAGARLRREHKRIAASGAGADEGSADEGSADEGSARSYYAHLIDEVDASQRVDLRSKNLKHKQRLKQVSLALALRTSRLHTHLRTPRLHMHELPARSPHTLRMYAAQAHACAPGAGAARAT